jgi:hypothetical protein
MTPEIAEKTLRLNSAARKADDTPSANVLSSMMDLQPFEDTTSLENLAEGLRGFPVECLSTERWELKMFLAAMGSLSALWTMDEFNMLLQCLAFYIDGSAYQSLSQSFEKNYFVPTFSLPISDNVAVESAKEDWKNQLRDLVLEWEPVPPCFGDLGESIENDGGLGELLQINSMSPKDAALLSLRSHLLDYCESRLTLSSMLEARPGSTGSSSASSILENLAGASEEAESLSHEGVSTSISIQGTAKQESEREYKAFMKIMAGTYGLDSVKKCMAYLRENAISSSLQQQGVDQCEDASSPLDPTELVCGTENEFQEHMEPLEKSIDSLEDVDNPPEDI